MKRNISMRRRATTLQFGVEIEDRALFHFGAASQGAPLPSTFIAYSKRAQPASHKQCVEARRRGVLARACAGCVHFPAPPYFNPHFSPPPLPSFLFLPSSLSSPSSLSHQRVVWGLLILSRGVATQRVPMEPQPRRAALGGMYVSTPPRRTTPDGETSVSTRRRENE